MGDTMKFDIDKIQGGKTTRAIEWVKAGRNEGRKDSSNRILVVRSEQIKRLFMDSHGLGYHEIESINTILHGYHKPALVRKELWIDEIEYFLSAVFPYCFFAGINGTDQEIIEEIGEVVL